MNTPVIRCSHEKEGVPHNIEVDDYHPVDSDYVHELVTEARKSVDSDFRNAVHIRLCQGIKGMTRPRQVDGEVARKDYELSEYYIDVINGKADYSLSKFMGYLN